MMNIRKLASLCGLLALIGALPGCESMSRQDAATVGGAAVGGVVGNAVGDGSTLGTAGGAVAGGLIGREVTKD